jgi:Tfp pilus assembly protein PilO
MLKDLNQASPAIGALSFAAKPIPTAQQRSKSIMTILLLIAVVVFAIGAGIGYLLLSQIGEAQNKVLNLQAQEGTSLQIAKRYQTTLQSYDDTSSKLQFLETSVAPNQYIPTLLQQLQTLAQTTHLQVISIKPGPLASSVKKPAVVAVPAPTSAGAQATGTGPTKTPAAPPYDTQPFQLTVNGTFPQIMSFIYALPHFPKIMTLKTMTLSPKGATGAAAKTIVQPTLNATLAIDAYVFDSNAQTAASAPVVTVDSSPISSNTGRSGADSPNGPGLPSKTVDGPSFPVKTAPVPHPTLGQLN